MIGTPFRLFLIAVFVGVGALALHKENGAIAGMSMAVALVLMTTWIRYGGVMAAGRHFRSGRRNTAWNELCRVPLRGRLLARGVRPYYHLLRAAIQIDRAEWHDVIADCDAVLAIKKTKSANHATAHGAKAKSLAMLGEDERAREHLRLARSMPHKPALDGLLARVAESLDESDGPDDGP